jgi:oligopeptide/dipeptide ABC transporter ATP-binding protein
VTAPAAPPPAAPLPSAAPLAVTGLTVAYGSGQGRRARWNPAVTDVSLELPPGGYLGVVGESGCGKSTLVHAVLGLLPAGARVTGGSILVAGQEIIGLGDKQLRPLRWRTASVVLQSGMNALNPLLTVRRQFRDLYKAHGLPVRDADGRCAALLERVQVPAARAASYPHQLSGGMRQRVCIALALALDPHLVILDEPTTALDVIVQRGIFDLIDELRGERGFAVLLVSHDLALVQERADRVAVMYAGRVVESRPAAALAATAAHPYTRGLLAAAPRLGERRGVADVIPGAPPQLGALPPGCAFHPRCPRRGPECDQQVPPLTADHDGALACFHPVTPPGPVPTAAATEGERSA